MNKNIRLLLLKYGIDASSREAYCKSISLFLADEMPQNIIDWTRQNRIIDHQPFSFEGRQYLERLYTDPTPEINIVKSRQMEITEFGLNWLLFNLLQNKQTVGLYVSDRFEHVKIFSNL